MARGGVEQVGEYQWRARKVAAGVVGHEEGRRRGLSGGLGGSDANGGRRRLWTPRGARLGAWSRGEGGGRGRGLVCEAKGREESRAEGASERRRDAWHGSARSSPWRVDGRPRRACREMAPRGEAERLRENQGRSAATAQRVADGETANAITAGTEKGDGVDDNIVINSKFQNFIL